jgi:alpha-mannosidase II
MLHWNTQEEELIDMRQLVAQLPFDNPDGGAWKQGWDVQPIHVDQQNPLQIFVVPHSHCDPGWIKTFDDYFQSQTRQILTSVYQALMADDRRRFIWAEISYFEWWFREQDASVQENTKQLIRDKRLEFVTGGWVQPDEANTDIFAMEVQLQEGHEWIRSNIDPSAVPVYHWSIDPFGYSPTMAALLHKYKFKGMLIQRVHYAVKKELAKRKHLEFRWRQTWDTHGTYDMFTHVMPFYSYDIPHTCGPDPSICCQFDFARINRYGGCPWRKKPQTIEDANVAERAMLVLDQWKVRDYSS